MVFDTLNTTTVYLLLGVILSEVLPKCVLNCVAPIETKMLPGVHGGTFFNNSVSHRVTERRLRNVTIGFVAHYREKIKKMEHVTAIIFLWRSLCFEGVDITQYIRKYLQHPQWQRNKLK